MRPHKHKGCACVRVTGCFETSESSNTAVPAPGDMGREPGFTLYGLFCRERKLGPEEPRGFLFNQNHAEPCRVWAASQAGQELRNALCSPKPGLGMGQARTRSCSCLTMSLCINIFVYMCLDLCIFRHYLHRCGHRHVRIPRSFCVCALTVQLLIQTSAYSFCRCGIRQRDAYLQHQSQPHPTPCGLFLL